MKLTRISNSVALFILAGIMFFTSCKNSSHRKSPTFELKGDMAQAGEGIKVYLDRLLPNDSVEHLDSVAIDKDGKFVFNTVGIFKGFYTVRIAKGDFAV